MDDIKFDDEIMFDDELSPPVELNIYSIRKKDGGRLGEVSATSEADAMDQAEGMGFTRGTYSVVRKYDKPTTVKGREELLIKRGMNQKEASTMAKVAPYVSSDVYDKPLSEVSLMSGPAQRDVFSLPGRFIASNLGGTNEGEDQWTSMGRTAEDEGTNFGGSIVRAPSTGVATLLAPLSAMGVGATGLASPWLVGALEGGSIGAGTSAFNYATDEDYTIADAAIETLLSAGIGSLIKGGSAKSIAKAKEMIKSAGNFTQNQIDYIYSKLGITRGGTEQKLSKAVPERIGDIANIEFIMTRPPNADELYAKMPAHMADVLESGTKRYITEDLSYTLPYDVSKSFNNVINQQRLHGTMSVAEAKAKRAILDEFNESMNELRKLGSSTGASRRLYLDRLLDEAKYFYNKDRDLGDIFIKAIETQYNENFNQLVDLKDIINFTDLNRSNITKSFGDISASIDYLRTPPTKTSPRPFNITEPGSWVGQTAGRAINSPEKAKIVGNTLQSLRMPSIVSTQDVLSNTSVPDYINLNELK